VYFRVLYNQRARARNDNNYLEAVSCQRLTRRRLYNKRLRAHEAGPSFARSLPSPVLLRYHGLSWHALRFRLKETREALGGGRQQSSRACIPF
jgi:hypothetical protein